MHQHTQQVPRYRKPPKGRNALLAYADTSPPDLLPPDLVTPPLSTLSRPAPLSDPRNSLTVIRVGIVAATALLEAICRTSRIG